MDNTNDDSGIKTLSDESSECSIEEKSESENELFLTVPDIPNSKQKQKMVKEYVMAVDIGTTMLRCHVCDVKGNVKGVSSRKMELLRPSAREVEIDENKLWENFQYVVKDTLRVASLSSEQIHCMGLTMQRGTFILWNRDTGKPYHHFICWQDARASELVEEWNNSFTLKSYRSASRVIHAMTGKPLYGVLKRFRFKLIHVTLRLAYMLDSIPEVRKDAIAGKVMFGTLDTWLIWKLSGEKEHLTEYSNASCTGFFDPEALEWSTNLCNMVNIPMKILPKVCDTSGEIARTSRAIFGASIPITAVIADQQAAMFAHGCYDKGDVKVTLGTGTFLNVNTGDKATYSSGLSPIVAWKLSGEAAVYCAEASACDTGNVIEWAQKMQLFQDVSDSAGIAASVPDSGGVYFVPAFSGLQSPIDNDTACSALLGISPSTSKVHVLRAVLESVVFVFKLIYEMALNETKIPFNQLRVDGGVSNNDFVVQLMSDLTNQAVYRPTITDQTIMGATYLAGLGSGFWKSREDLERMKRAGHMFTPNQNWDRYRHVVTQWERALKRTMNWYKYSPAIRQSFGEL